MQLVKVESSNIEAIGHEGNVLRVEFKTGAAYDYKGVPAEVHRDLMQSNSKGRFLDQHIKKPPGKYPFEPVAA